MDKRHARRAPPAIADRARADAPRRGAARRGLDRHRVEGAERRRPDAAGDPRQGAARRPRARLPPERPRPEPAPRPLAHHRHHLHRQLRPLHHPDRRGARGAAGRRRHRGLHVQRHRRPGARAPASRPAARQAHRRAGRHRPPRRPAPADRPGRPRPAGGLRLLAGRRPRRALPAARRRGRRAAGGRASRPASAAGASPTSPGPSISRRCACAAPAIAAALAAAGLATVDGLYLPAPGPRPGAARRSAGCSTAGPRRPTRSSAATTRSPAAPRTRCASAASRSPATSPSSASTTGTSWREAARPPLTSVDMNLRALGREAGERLIAMIAGDADARGAPPALLAGGAAVVRADEQEGAAMGAVQPVRISSMSRSRAPFWRERLETVLARTIPSQHAQLAAHGILESLTLPDPPPPLRYPAQPPQLHRPGVLGLRRRQSGSRPPSYALSHRRDADIEARIEAIVDDLGTRPGARRLPQLLVPRPRARQALDQPPRQPRALQPRPPARRRHRLFPRHRPPAAPRHPGALRRPRARRPSGPARARSAAIAATRRSSWR